MSASFRNFSEAAFIALAYASSNGRVSLNLKNLALAPVTVQEEVPGVSVRVFVAGERVMACELGTEALDYRDDPDSRLRRCNLPPAV